MAATICPHSAVEGILVLCPLSSFPSLLSSFLIQALGSYYYLLGESAWMERMDQSLASRTETTQVGEVDHDIHNRHMQQIVYFLGQWRNHDPLRHSYSLGLFSSSHTAVPKKQSLLQTGSENCPQCKLHILQ